MAKAAKTDATREELLAQLETLDRQDEINQRDAEISALKETLERVSRERDTFSRQVTELSRVLKVIHEALRPYEEALGNPTGGGVYRGRRRGTPQATTGSLASPREEEQGVDVTALKVPKKDAKGLAAHFPDLSADGPGEVVEADD